MEWMANEIYNELGVRPFINAAGPKCAYGGTLISSAVLDAMAAASKTFVHIAELNKRIGEYIASITGAEAGMVTSGASSGIVLSIAACMTGLEIHKIRKLPNTLGMKDELIIQKIHRGPYSYMYTFSGAKLVEVGDATDCLPEELEGAITEKTAAIHYLQAPRVPKTGLTLKQITKIARTHNIPVIVDSAMLPPKYNLRKYIEEGADLVVFSGGKMIHGPQATGILFGKKDLVDAALANASPNQAIGRPHKVSKEDMIGLYVALKSYMNTDEEKTLLEYRQRLEPIVDALSGIAGVRANIIHDNINYTLPNAVIQFDEEWLGLRGHQLSKKLFSGEPRIYLPYYKGLDHLVINPVNLQPGEPDLIAKFLYEELTVSAQDRKIESVEKQHSFT